MNIMAFIAPDYTTATERGKCLGEELGTTTAVTAAALLARASLTSAVSVSGFLALLPVQQHTPAPQHQSE